MTEYEKMAERLTGDPRDSIWMLPAKDVIAARTALLAAAEREEGLIGAWKMQQARAEAAEQRAEKAEADAERYRWIRDQMVNVDEKAQETVQLAWNARNAAQLDAAIDAALRGQP